MSAMSLATKFCFYKYYMILLNLFYKQGEHPYENIGGPPMNISTAYFASTFFLETNISNNIFGHIFLHN
jgi:hypothetical protein